MAAVERETVLLQHGRVPGGLAVVDLGRDEIVGVLFLLLLILIVIRAVVGVGVVG